MTGNALNCTSNVHCFNTYISVIHQQLYNSNKICGEMSKYHPVNACSYSFHFTILFHVIR